jgi:PqqD family protein of HPr-rel-A system
MWRLIRGQSLQFKSWDGEAVLYNQLSGDTHLLGENAIHLLQALQASDLEQDAVVDSLCAAFQVVRDADAEREAAALLAELSALSLIEQLAC